MLAFYIVNCALKISPGQTARSQPQSHLLSSAAEHPLICTGYHPGASAAQAEPSSCQVHSALQASELALELARQAPGISNS